MLTQKRKLKIKRKWLRKKKHVKDDKKDEYDDIKFPGAESSVVFEKESTREEESETEDEVVRGNSDCIAAFAAEELFNLENCEEWQNL